MTSLLMLHRRYGDTSGRALPTISRSSQRSPSFQLMFAGKRFSTHSLSLSLPSSLSLSPPLLSPSLIKVAIPCFAGCSSFHAPVEARQRECECGHKLPRQAIFKQRGDAGYSSVHRTTQECRTNLGPKAERGEGQQDSQWQ